MPVHARVSVSGLCFPELSAVEVVAALGVGNTSMTGTKLRESGPPRSAPPRAVTACAWSPPPAPSAGIVDPGRTVRPRSGGPARTWAWPRLPGRRGA
ncbi:hypothetical protein LRP67_02970 [Nocardioides sp. cx-169]|uniref:hypothetical protein n=1 Tax=Nocardioides sp. cx-169 TaxID=2899080 RepID=UPI001E49730D|nr:hypothetical protein [Nocardioides sp. cx-169]MCD4533041.1 hypothetical protein [Nocardioides sp. cx-169]